MRSLSLDPILHRILEVSLLLPNLLLELLVRLLNLLELEDSSHQLGRAADALQSNDRVELGDEVGRLIHLGFVAVHHQHPLRDALSFQVVFQRADVVVRQPLIRV